MPQRESTNWTIEQSVVTVKALMLTMLVQEHKDKTITHTVHKVLTWFCQPFANHAYVHEWERIIPLYNREYYRG